MGGGQVCYMRIRTAIIHLAFGMPVAAVFAV